MKHGKIQEKEEKEEEKGRERAAREKNEPTVVKESSEDKNFRWH